MSKDSIANDILNNVKHIIKNNTFDKLNTICSIVKLKRNEHIINFAYIMSNYDFNSKIVKNQIISIGNSLISKDGEVRYDFINIDNIDKKNELFTYMKKYVNDMINQKYISIYHENFSHNEIKNTDKFKLMSYKDIYIDLYIIALLNELCNIRLSLAESHANENFVKMFLSPFDIKHFNKIATDANIQKFVKMINTNMKSHNLEIIQKTSPMKYNELKNYNKLITHSGKELLINKIVSSMKYSSVGNGFALMVNWFFITNSSQFIYNNQNIISKLSNNKKTINTLNYLNKAKIEIREINNDDNLAPVYKKIIDNINMIENDYLYVNVSLSILLERVGVSLFSAINYINDDNKIIINKIGNFFTNHNLFAKYMFNIIYSLYILNLNGIIHGDLHLNNVTITTRNTGAIGKKFGYDLCSSINENHLKYLLSSPNKKTDFKIDDNKKIGNKFIFTNVNNNYSCLIDYSRSFIYINDHIPYDIYERYHNNDRKRLRSTEELRFKSELKKLLPILETEHIVLNNLFKPDNFPKMFIIYSAVDSFKITTSLYIYITTNRISMHPDSLAMIKSIAQFSFKQIESLLDRDFFNQDKYLFPNYRILMTFFNKFKIDQLTDNNIVDIFAIDNIKNQYNYFNNENKSEISSNDFHKDSSNNIDKFINKILNEKYNNEANEMLPIKNSIDFVNSK